jgi:hypothetical protein
VKAKANSVIAFILPRLPPAIDGVGDYTARLCEHSPILCDSIFFLQHGISESLGINPLRTVLPLASNAPAIVNDLAMHNVEVIILQYSAFGFHKKAYPSILLDSLYDWKVANPAHKLLVMAHELWFNPSYWNPNYIIQLQHKRKLIRLLNAAEHVFTSTVGYAEILDRYLPGKAQALGIGSNILPASDPHLSHRDPYTWVLFGRQQNRINTLDVFREWLPLLFAAGLISKIEVVGSVDSAELMLKEEGILRTLFPSSTTCFHGELKSEDISKVLNRCRYGLYGASPESSTKSGVFMAYASHKIGIISHSNWPKNVPYAELITSPQQLLDLAHGNFDIDIEMERKALGLLRWFNSHASWPHIANEYVSVLRQISCSPLNRKGAYKVVLNPKDQQNSNH